MSTGSKNLTKATEGPGGGLRHCCILRIKSLGLLLLPQTCNLVL